MRQVKDKKIVYICLSAAVGVLALSAFLFVEYYAKTHADKNIKINYDSGFYESAIDVEISVGSNYFLTYTLDGSNPSAMSTRYEGPIHVEDASENENVFSNIKETCGKYYMESSPFAIPSEKVDKCTLLRVCAFDYNGNKVSGALREYFVGFDQKKGYDGLYTVCVSTDPEYLFSDDIGIYVLGADFREFIDSGEAEKFDWISNYSKQREANWFKGGPLYERVATLEVFEPDDTLVLSTNCGMRIRGHDSRHLPQKSLGLYARGEYNNDDKERFDYDFFGNGFGPSSFIVSNCGDDVEVKIIDYVVYNALSAGENEFPVSKMLPCNLFLNGEYWGPMFIMDDLNADNIATAYNVGKKNVRLLKSGEFKGNDQIAEVSTDAEDWKKLCDYITENDMSDSANYDYVCSQMDMESFVDYVATELYLGNNNWRYSNNFACWRTAKPESGNKYADCKWRFCLYDVNDTFRGENHVEEAFKKTLDLIPIIRKLGDNPEFEKMFKDRMVEMSDMFSEEKVTAIIDEWSSFMEEPVECFYIRFENKPGIVNQTETEKQHIIDYCKNRPNQIETLYELMFD